MEASVKMEQSIPFIKGLALETRMLVAFLSTRQVGDVVTDDEMTRLIGKSTAPGGEGYWCLRTAIKRVRSDSGHVWGRDRGCGRIRFLNGPETVGVAKAARKHINRTTRVVRAELATINPQNLDAQTRREYEGEVISMGVLHQFSKPHAVKQIADYRDKHNVILPPRMNTGRLLAHFGEQIQEEMEA